MYELVGTSKSERVAFGGDDKKHFRDRWKTLLNKCSVLMLQLNKGFPFILISPFWGSGTND